MAWKPRPRQAEARCQVGGKNPKPLGFWKTVGAVGSGPVQASSWLKDAGGRPQRHPEDRIQWTHAAAPDPQACAVTP